MVYSAYFVKSTPLRAFTGSFQHFADMLQTYWRYAWRNLMQKKYFLTNLQGFLLSHFSMTVQSNWWLIVYTLWNQLLLELLLDLFNTLKICCRHIEDVHEVVWCRKNIFWQTVCRGYQVSCTYCPVSFFLQIFLLISGVIQGIEETDLLVFDGICLSAESWIKEVNKSKFSWPHKLIIKPKMDIFSDLNNSCLPIPGWLVVAFTNNATVVQVLRGHHFWRFCFISFQIEK